VFELETSISQLKSEIIINEASTQLPPSIGFMTNAELHFSKYDSQTLPNNALFSAWILGNENLVLSHKVSSDQVLHFTFQNFKTMMSHGFNQDIEIHQ
jgi:hypothetical protein